MSERIAKTEQGEIRLVRTLQPEPHALALVIENQEIGENASITLTAETAVLLAGMLEAEGYLVMAERLARSGP